MRAIAEAVSRRLGLPVKSIAPEEAQDFFGPLAMFVTLDMPASSRQTREKLGWEPVGPGLIADLEQLRVHDLSITRPRSSRWAMIAIDLFPQLKRLAWNRPGKRTIAEPEALALYLPFMRGIGTWSIARPWTRLITNPSPCGQGTAKPFV